VRKLVKLVIFFSLSFAVLLLISTGLRFLVLRVEWVRMLSLEQEAMLVEIIAAARWALSFGLYGGLLLGLSYIARNRVFVPLAIPIVAVMTLGFIFGIDEALKSWENVPPSKNFTRPLGGPGLMLANSTRSSGTVIVLLEGPEKPGGSRVVAIPGEPLLYQEEFAGRNLPAINLPPAPFADDTPWMLNSLAIDIRLSSENMRQLLNKGLDDFLIYVGALIFFLSSLIFIFRFSAWPLANLFLGCLAFRGVLALEIFFNTPDMQEVFDSFLQNRLPVSLAVPLIFCAVGLLAHLYSFLIFVAKKRSDYEF
jgi:hypothetical protein